MANGIVLNIDTTKSEFQNPMVQLRQGDGNYQSLAVTVTSNGEPLNLTGWTTMFMGTTAGGFKVVDGSVSVTNTLQGEFTYTPTKAWGQDQGEFKNAYFKFTKADETASGASFRVNVLDAVDLTAEEAGDYISVVDVMIDKIKTDMDNKLADTQTTLTNTQLQANTVQSNVNDLNTNVNDLKAQNNNIKTSDNTWTGKNTFDLPIVGNISGTATTANDPQAIHINDFGVTTDFKQPVGTKFVDKLNNEFIQRGVNVKWYGAKGDGVTDDSQAFIDAMNDAGSSTIIVPDGTYIISKTIFVNRKDLVGRNKQNTILKFAGSAKSYLQILYNARIQNLTIDLTEVDDGGIGIEAGTIYNENGHDQYAGAQNNIISDLYVVSDPAKKNTIGISLTAKLLTNFTNNTTGIYNNIFQNIWFNKLGTGFYIDAQKRGWVNGNTFNKITVSGYGKYGVWFGQSNTDGQGLQVNNFTSLQLQQVDHSNNDAVGLNISGGSWNNFTNISHWNDSNYLGTPRPDIVAVNIVPDANGSVYGVYDNKISGKVEGIVNGDGRIFDRNDINIDSLNVENYSKLLPGSMYQTKVRTLPIDNMLPYDIIGIYEKTPKLSTLLFNNDTGIVYPLIERDAGGKYIKMVNSVGSTILNLSIFGDQLQMLKDSAIGTISFKIKSSSEASTPLFTDLYGRDTAGNPTNLKQYLVRTEVEKTINNDFIIHIILDFVSNRDIIQNLNNIIASLGFTIIGTSQYVGIRDIKFSPRSTNHFSNYTLGHKSTKLTTVITDTPASWADIGVYPVDPSKFEPFTDSMVTYHNLQQNIFVESIFMV